MSNVVGNVFVRGGWEISSRDLHDSQVITMVPSGRGFMDLDDDYYYPTARSTVCYRSVAIIVSPLLPSSKSYVQFGSLLKILIKELLHIATLFSVHESLGSSTFSSSHDW